MSRHLVVDFETRSTCDLTEAGAWAYARDPSTEVLLGCLLWLDDPDDAVRVWLPGMPCPREVLDCLEDRSGRVVAHNASFDVAVWRHVLTPRHGWPELEPWRVVDTLALACSRNVEGRLAAAATSLKLAASKDTAAGDAFVRTYTVPWQGKGKGKTDEGPRWRLMGPRALAMAIAYAADDVRTARALCRKTRRVPGAERPVEVLTLEANARGVAVDLELARAIRDTAARERLRLDERLCRVTGGALSRVTRASAIGAWLAERGYDLGRTPKGAPSAETDAVRRALMDGLFARDEVARAVAELRVESAQLTTTAKAEAALAWAPDGIFRGGQRYYGAGATGRMSGAGLQVQNIPRPKAKTAEALAEARARVLAGEGTLQDAVDSLRAMLVARPGHVLVAADLSQIEARLLAWLGGHDWPDGRMEAPPAYAKDRDILQAFARGDDVYCRTAEELFRQPPGTYGKSSPERQVGKVAVLQLGYQAGAEGFWRHSRKPDVNLGLTEAQAAGITAAWRASRPGTVACWKEFDKAAWAALKEPGRVVRARCCSFVVQDGALVLHLPSGRALYHHAAKLAKGPPIKGSDGKPWSPEQITYWGRKGSEGAFAWRTTYGGSLVQSATQALARDVMVRGLSVAVACGYSFLFGVHDELVTEVPEDRASELDDALLCRLLTRPVPYLPGLPLAAEGWVGPCYRK